MIASLRLIIAVAAFAVVAVLNAVTAPLALPRAMAAPDL